jgi:hypothetical protein
MTDRNEINLDYRPDSYWDGPETLVANIKGDVRKRTVVSAIEKGKADSLPAEAFADSVTEDDKEALTERGRAFLGGEELPDYDNGEIEIARICINPFTHRVISNRAAIGAIVRIKIGAKTLTRQVESGAGHSANGLILHFGLGTHTGEVELEISWPYVKAKQTATAKVNRLVTVVCNVGDEPAEIKPMSEVRAQ